MDAFLYVKYGEVRDYNSTITEDTEQEWSNNPQGLAALFDNKGSSSAFLEAQGTEREILPGDAYVLAGYHNSTRMIAFNIRFSTGVGLKNKLLITQDVQDVPPVLVFMDAEGKLYEREMKFCNDG